MLTIDQINVIYAGLLAVGGAIGYLKAGSTASLMAGGGSAMIVYGATTFRWPFRTLIVAGVAGMLGYIMGQRFQRSNKFMPAGLMAASSVVTLIAQIYKMSNTHSLH